MHLFNEGSANFIHLGFKNSKMRKGKYQLLAQLGSGLVLRLLFLKVLSKDSFLGEQKVRDIFEHIAMFLG